MAKIWSKEEGPSDDVWDDTELIKMYEKSIKSTYDAVDEKVNEKQFKSDCGTVYNWKVGDKCMAPYSEDKSDPDPEFFPATINWISKDKNDVSVTYDGYGNEEVVNIENLWRQEELEDNEKDEEEILEDVTMTSPAPQDAKQVPVMPPPPPPSFFNAAPPTDTEALTSMLMSWYMSGYHTGYYQAMKDSKKKGNKKK